VGSVDLHPAVQHIADKGYERMTLDEAAIVHGMRRALLESYNSAEILRVWLQQENPLDLKGPALAEWATEISDWVLPTQMRRHHAVAKGIEQESHRAEHQDGDSSWQATEAGGGHSAEQSSGAEGAATT
jgi:hypothetical protein